LSSRNRMANSTSMAMPTRRIWPFMGPPSAAG
jgi:hypothetical protein